MKAPRITFSVVLPLLDLALFWFFVAVPTTMMMLHLWQTARGSNAAHVESGTFTADVPRNRFFAFALETAAAVNSHKVVAANLPGFVGEILVSLPTSWPDSWRPSGFTLDAWRALTWPAFALPCWWLVGRAIDSLFGWSKLHWTALLLGSLLFAFCTTGSLVYAFGMSAAERGEDVHLISGFILWTVLFAALPAAWIRQWRSRIKSRQLMATEL
jgi:hypothetical protein